MRKKEKRQKREKKGHKRFGLGEIEVVAAS